jgi:hypothetical protein
MVPSPKRYRSAPSLVLATRGRAHHALRLALGLGACVALGSCAAGGPDDEDIIGWEDSGRPVISGMDAGLDAASGTLDAAGRPGADSGPGTTGGGTTGGGTTGGGTTGGGDAGPDAGGSPGASDAAPDGARNDAGPGGGTTGGGGDGGTSSAVVRFEKNVKISDDTGRGRQTEVALAAGPDGLVLAGWMDERATRVCAFSFSTDGGQTWSKNVSIPNSGGQFVGDPAVAIDAGGTLYAVCQQYINPGSTGNIRLMTSRDKGTSWSEIRSIQSAPDKPWAAGGVTPGTLYISWLGNPGGIKKSTDYGMTWGPIQSTGNIIHGTGITATSTGLVHVPYNLDSSRNQLRYLRSKDGGNTYEAPRDLVANMGTFCFSCNPRQHPIVGSDSDPTGKFVAMTWTSRMTGGQNDDDVWLVYSKDGGDTFTQPIRVNDNQNASRQFESWAAVDSYGRVHVAWTDFRNGGQNETWYARSSDPSKGFEPNIQVTDGRGSGSTDFLGDYKGIAVQGNDVLVVWQDTRNDSGDIYFARALGAAGPP